MAKRIFDICVVGGAGHVGLPLSILFATKKKRVLIYDVNQNAMRSIKKGNMPFLEYGAEPLLRKALKKTLFFASKINEISLARTIIITLPTPVDEYLNPTTRLFIEAILKLRPYLSPQQTIIIRSTVYPRTCEQLQRSLQEKGDEEWHIAYCPERTIQGHAIQEIQQLPQIVSGLSQKAVDDARKLFGLFASTIIEIPVGEAELVKLFTNAWRYIQFAVTNQFYMIAENFGVDYNSVRKAMTESYGRLGTLPTAGFAAGPCLLKDTMQLSAFSSHNFLLGHAALMVNEGLPNFLVEKLRTSWDLSTATVGILGMAFKADIDDPRDSLSYKLGKILRFHGTKVLYSDEYIHDPTFVKKDKVLEEADIIIIGVPHTPYKMLRIPNTIFVIDLWGVVKGGRRTLP